jgi:O-acetyl-ADP-ribose deacetylase (regulator of RNase III)
MTTQSVSGDLFDNTHEAQAFAHGCNCQGSMGSGIAKTFRARYPEMYKEYPGRCKSLVSWNTIPSRSTNSSAAYIVAASSLPPAKECWHI